MSCLFGGERTRVGCEAVCLESMGTKVKTGLASLRKSKRSKREGSRISEGRMVEIEAGGVRVSRFERERKNPRDRGKKNSL